MRVEVYDGSFTRVAEIAGAGEIAYSRSLGQRDSARFVVPKSDPQIGLLDPRAGSVIVLASDDAPTWAGMIERMRGDPSGRVTFEARSFDAILDARYLPADALYSGSAARAFYGIIGSSGAINPHGIEVGSVSATGQRFVGAFPRQSARRALETVADAAGTEWWVDTVAASSRLRVLASMAEDRGRDRYDEVALIHGAGVDVRQWIVDGQASTWATTVVGGASSPIQAVADRASARVVADAGKLIHGRWRVKVPDGASVATRRERLVVAEALRDAGRVKEAAAVSASRPQAAERVDVLVTDRTRWKDCQPGDVVHLVADWAFLSGLDSAVRITSTEVNEDAGEMALVVQLLEASA